MREEVNIGCNVESCVFKDSMGSIYSKSHTYAGFLKETRVHVKKLILRVFLGIFRLWCLLETFN